MSSISSQDVRDELHTLLFSEADARTLRQELTTSSLNAQDQRGSSIWFNSVNLMQKHAWLGRMSSPFLRGICWRICFDIFNNNSKVSFTKPGRSLPVDASLYDIWAQEIIEGKKDYEAMLKEAMPDAANISEDPLSSLSQSNEQSEGWRAYYKKVELANFIKVDLDRLYLQGLEDDIARNEGKNKAASENDDGEEEISFFFVHPIPERLLNILMLFSMKNDKVSYRQGMHEICGIVYYVLYTEAKHWSNLGSSSDSSSGGGIPHPLQAVFRDEYLESQVYFLFSQVMKGLLPLYDPTPRNKGFSESVPAIVDYCTRIQEHFLLQVDADLCNHLQDCYIQGQIYGMRWSRLLLSREFPVTHDFSLKIWDFLFVTCMELSPPEKVPSSSTTSPVVLVIDGTLAPNNSTLLADKKLPDNIDPLVNSSHVTADPLSSDLPTTPTKSSVNATLSSSPTKMSSNLNDFMISELPSAQASMSSQTKALRERYGDYSTLMGVLGDFILAMLLNIRDDLMKGDSNEVLGLLMRYPKVTSVTPIMDLADMLRRGVLTAEAHISPQKNDVGSGSGSSSATKKYANAGLSSKPGRGGNTATSTPAWLLSSVANSIPAINNTAMNMSRKVSENISAAVSYVKSKGGSSDSSSPSPPPFPAPASPIPSSSNNNNNNSNNSNTEKIITTSPTPPATGNSSFNSNSNFDPLLGLDIETSGGSSSSSTMNSPSAGNSGLRRLNNFFSSSKVKEKEKTKEKDPGYSMNTFSDSSGSAIGSGLFGSTSSSSSSNSITSSSSKPTGPTPSEQVSQRLQAIADILDSALAADFSTHAHTTDTCTTDTRERDGELSARLRYLSSILQNKATAKDYDAQFPANCFNTISSPSISTSPSSTSPNIQTDTASNSDEYIADVVDTIT